MNFESETFPPAPPVPGPFFAQVKPEYWSHYIPETFVPILAHLADAHGIRVRAIYLDNVKSPTNEIYLDGRLPVDELARLFPPTERLGYFAGTVVDREAQASLKGAA